MESKYKKYRSIEWLSAEEMHKESVQWMSELKFAKDEQLFLNDLVRSHTLELIGNTVFDESKEIIDAILRSEKEVVVLMKKVQSHESLLKIMVDDVEEQTMEKAYINTHWQLTTEMQNYMGEYRKLKSRLFQLVSDVMKKQKQKRLLN